MADTSFFTHPKLDWQRRYEALRASFVERLPAHIVADRYGYTTSYIHLLRHQFKHGKLDFTEPPAEGTTRRRRVSAEVRQKIRTWRERKLSAVEITELLLEDGVEISVRTVERVLTEEGFAKLPRRTRLKIGMTVQGAEIPEKSQKMVPDELDGQRFDSPAAGVFLFAPFLAQLGFPDIVEAARLPGSQQIPALSYLLSFLALKLLGTERYAHVGEHGFDPGLGLFAGLNVLPKCTAMSSYAYALDDVHLQRLQETFIKQAIHTGLYDGSIINLDFHTVPHFGDESVLDRHWAGARGKVMKGALTLFAQDAQTKLLLYTQADIQRAEADDQILAFMSFWPKVWRGVKPTLVFDSRFTTYANLSRLNEDGIKFITLRRRGSRLVENVQDIKQWKRIHIPHGKRKYPNPLVHETTVHLRGYEGLLRQVIMKNNGREAPTFLITRLAEPILAPAGHAAVVDRASVIDPRCDDGGVARVTVSPEVPPVDDVRVAATIVRRDPARAAAVHRDQRVLRTPSREHRRQGVAAQQVLDVAVDEVVRRAVDLLGAALDADGAECARIDAPAVPIGRLEHEHVEAQVVELVGGVEAGCTCADDDDVVIRRGLDGGRRTGKQSGDQQKRG